jgi:hypothetical protein
MAPAAPKITYQNGLLSVESVNGRLIDILNGIRTKAGIQFEGLQTTQDRVAGKFGPARADQVLTSLLQGSRFDYVIIGMPENPALVQRVILSPSSSAAAAGSTPGAQPVQQPSGDEEENAGDDPAEAPEQVQAPEQMQQPAQIQPRGATTPKTTEQLLEELKRMQQQNQPQQNQQNQQPAPVKPRIPQ